MRYPRVPAKAASMTSTTPPGYSHFRLEPFSDDAKRRRAQPCTPRHAGFVGEVEVDGHFVKTLG